MGNVLLYLWNRGNIDTTKMKRNTCSSNDLNSEQSTSSQIEHKKQRTCYADNKIDEAGGDCSTVNKTLLQSFHNCKNDCAETVEIVDETGDNCERRKGGVFRKGGIFKLPVIQNVENNKTLVPVELPTTNCNDDFTNSKTDVIPPDSSHPFPLINDLPSTLLVHIFQYLSLQDTLHRVGLVCKQWHNLCCDPDIWRHIDLSGQLKVDDALLLRLTSYSGNVLSLNLTDVRMTTNEGMVATLKQCSQLRSLSLVRCMHLTDYAFLAIGEYCHQLVDLKLDNCAALTDQSLTKLGSGCPKLEKVWLNQCGSITDYGIIDFLQGCPNLKHLSMEQCKEISDSSLIPMTNNCPRLKYLRFMANDFSTSGLQLLSKLKELEFLEITQISSLSDDNVIHIVKNCPRLFTLNVSLCSNITDKSVAYLAEHAKNIKSLYLVACKLTDKALFSLADHCKSIEKVDVGWCTEITDAGAIKISEKCKRLQYLGLMRCDRVTKDASLSLVERFPQVNYSTMWLECERLLARARSAGYCTV